MKFSKYISKAVTPVMALFQKQHSCLSNKATTICGHSVCSLRQVPVRHNRGGKSTENKVRFAPPTMCRLTIQEYINHMEGFLQNPNQIVSSGNIEIDSVLNYMLQKARKEQLSVDVKVKLPTELVHSFDIVIILGNLLENAIDASKQTDEKVLNVYISFNQGVLKIEIENSCLEKLLLQGKNELGEVFFATTKRDKTQHGIGISSVKKIVEKYNGTMEIKHREQRFFVKIILYMPCVMNKND